MDEVCEVIITAPDATWLADFTGALVADRLCASVHNIAEIHSTYRWQGQVHSRPEARAALRTRRALVAAILDRVNREHPYEVPSVVALPIVDSNPAYMRWILSETIDSSRLK